MTATRGDWEYYRGFQIGGGSFNKTKNWRSFGRGLRRFSGSC